jgi:hypothetical protein
MTTRTNVGHSLRSLLLSTFLIRERSLSRRLECRSQHANNRCLGKTGATMSSSSFKINFQIYLPFDDKTMCFLPILLAQTHVFPFNRKTKDKTTLIFCLSTAKKGERKVPPKIYLYLISFKDLLLSLNSIIYCR